MTQEVLEPKGVKHIERTAPERQSQAPKKHRGYLLITVVAIVLAVAVIVGVLSRISDSHALAKETETLAVQSFSVIKPKAEPPQQELVLPSTLQAYTESPIYARTNGYLAKWYKDIGSRVTKGELLAEIETPEIDQELAQSRAAQEQANAQLALAKTSAQRWANLQKMDAVAQQETDERTSSYTQGQAALAAATANVRRLEQLESFKRVYAPFSGVITKRNIDIGALINAGNGGTNQELFDMARIDPIRVYVDVPENYTPSIHSGVHAKIELAALVGKQFTGNVVRTSDSIDPATRTLRTEIDVPNPKGELLPGSYAQVHFALNVQTPGLSVPVNALLFRAEGPRAAVVDSQGKVHLKPVVIGRDYGTAVQILGGLSPNDSIILNPSDSLEEGQQIQVSKESGNS
ncbi:MAG TPA: efflux RND transporter periplasmic adaptor subunit [Terriglobales bacterium]|nr:efflux RND transporter periplasmic adaptor subunit [Terriglobales bacterium]